MDFSPDHKKEIETNIVQAIITALEGNGLSKDELPKIADFVLERIDSVKNHDGMVAFLDELSSTWPIFINIASIEKGEVKEKVEDEVTEGVLTLAKSGKIDEAIDLAKTMTEG